MIALKDASRAIKLHTRQGEYVCTTWVVTLIYWGRGPGYLETRATV